MNLRGEPHLMTRGASTISRDNGNGFGKLTSQTVVSSIDRSHEAQLSDIYREVFKGHPWHEDKICANVLRSSEDPLKCKVQYTLAECNRFDKGGERVVNDCRSGFTTRLNPAEREGIVLLRPGGDLERCMGCGDELNLIDFYPDFVDHLALIDEAISKRTFLGCLAWLDDKPIGFAWGYSIQTERTSSVNFPAILHLLEGAGINPETAFYGAEVGVLDRFQGKHIGTLLMAYRLNQARQSGYESYVTRTINPSVSSMASHIFSEKKGRLLFKDPERSSSWYKWDFADFNQNYVNNIMAGKLK
ncbi:MAG: GNAT family N-acetyltransferase [Nanoarchaeota archaeon]|nr:GNAT family N-acetyltransferase [Nanoarchaeota archaeon]